MLLSFAQLEGRIPFQGLSIELSSIIHVFYGEVITQATWMLAKQTLVNTLKMGLVGTLVSYLYDKTDQILDILKALEKTADWINQQLDDCILD